MARRKSTPKKAGTPRAKTAKPKATKTKRTNRKPSKRTVTRTVPIVNKLGLHARPAALFVQTANGFPNCTITVSNHNERVNGKSIMGMMTLAAACGSELMIEAVGDRAEEAIEALCQLIANKFDEE
jgi:phosphocarrier protein